MCTRNHFIGWAVGLGVLILFLYSVVFLTMMPKGVEHIPSF
jgi:hypothetical protein